MCSGALSSNCCMNCLNLNATIKDFEDSHSLIEIDLENIHNNGCEYWWSKVCGSSSMMSKLDRKPTSENKFVLEVKLSEPLPDNLQIFVWCKEANNFTFVDLWSLNSAGKLYLCSFVISLGNTHHDSFRQIFCWLNDKNISKGRGKPAVRFRI